jgi:LemA protein
MTALIVFLVVAVAAVALYVISTQRTLVQLEELCKNALSQIGVQLTSRWDLVQALVKMVEKYSKHEHDTMMDTINARRGERVESADDVQKQEQAIGTVIGQIRAVAERYPDLKAIEAYQKAMNSMDEYEDKVRTSRMVFNDTVTKMNRMVRQFPSNLVARMLGFGLQEYLKVDEKKTEYPDLG